MEANRGFTVKHQRLCLAVDLCGKLKGHTELTIVPTIALSTIYLNVRGCNILACFASPVGPVPFAQIDPLSPETGVYTPSDEARGVKGAYPELKRKLFSAENEADQGELAISLPQETVKVVSPAVEDELPNFAPINVLIEYEVFGSNDGIRFVNEQGKEDVMPHVYTIASAAHAARCWIPCVDRLHERCTWTLEFVVPKSIIGSVDNDDHFTELGRAEEDKVDTTEEHAVVAVASGDLVEIVEHPDHSSQLIYHYTIPTATSAQHIALAVGPFQSIQLAAAGEGQPDVRAFCLAGLEEELEHSTDIVERGLKVIAEEAGAFPFDSYKLLFVDDSPTTVGSTMVHNSVAFTILPGEMLHPATVIEQTYETRQVLANAFAQQWYGIKIVEKAWHDTWLIHGLSSRMASLVLRKIHGSNEYHFRMKKDILRCCELDVRMPPLCQFGRLDPIDGDILPFVNLKAPLVLHILDRKLVRLGLSNGLTRVLNQIALHVSLEKLKGNALSTANFMRACRKLAGADMAVFAEQWIYGSGCPHFELHTVFDKKNMRIQFHFEQTSPAYETTKHLSWPERAHMKPVRLFEGQITVRVHEADGVPYEHVLDIRETKKQHDVKFNTKYKRLRRADRNKARKTDIGGEDEAFEISEEVDAMESGFELKLWEDEEERKRWHVAEWNDEVEKRIQASAYEWIRVDADFEWLCTINYKQPDYYWIAQLHLDRDVVAQVEAIHALARLPSPMASTELTRTVLNTEYFYNIRAEAAAALPTCATAKVDNVGLFHLLKLFHKSACLFDPAVDPLVARALPKPNDFSDLAEYFVQKALIRALARVRTAQGQCPTRVQRLLIDVLAYNDNTENFYSDAYYLSTIIHALSYAFAAEGVLETSQLDDRRPSEGYATDHLDDTLQVLEAAMGMDRIVPSYRNEVTISGLNFVLEAVLAGHLPIDHSFFLAFTREGNYAPVRMEAFDCLLILGATINGEILSYFRQTLCYDTSAAVRRRLARGLVESILAHAALEEVSFDANEPSGEFEESYTAQARGDGSGGADKALRSVRHKLGRDQNLRMELFELLRCPELDLDVRWCMLKLSELLVKPSAEALPRIRFRMPSNAALSQRRPSGADERPKIRLTASVPAKGPPKMHLQVDLPSNKRPREESPELPLQAVAKSKIPKRPRFEKESEQMSMENLKGCQSIIKELRKRQKTGCQFFGAPVDMMDAPDYYNVIKHPMDLGTMSAKLVNGQYPNPDAFRKDFKIMIKNAKIYNGPESEVTKLAIVLDEAFEESWKRVKATLDRLAGRKPQAVNHSPPRFTISLPSPAGSTKDKRRASEEMLPPPVPTKIKLGRPTERKDPMPPPALKRKAGDEIARPSVPKKVKIESSVGVSIPAPPKIKMKLSATKPPVLASAPLGPPFSTAQAPRAVIAFPNQPFVAKRAHAALKKLVAANESYFFRDPVPRMTSGPLATYYQEIEHPMDLQEMSRKIDQGRYRDLQSLNADFQLIVGNAYTFNPPATHPRIHADAMVKLWNAEWSKPPSLSHTEKREIRAFLKKLADKPEGFVFKEPVDPVKFNIPTYFDIIPRENARDISLIAQKLDADVYTTQDTVQADLNLMIQNATTFNPPGDLVHNCALKIAADVKRFFTKLSTGKSTSKGGSSSKK